ncbi:hypothetical protein D3C78_1927650 [compost metagenome]
MKDTFLKKSSSEILQPADTDGKYPHLLFGPNTDEASARKLAVNKYLLSYV